MAARHRPERRHADTSSVSVSPAGFRPSRRAVLKGAVALVALPVAGFTTERRLGPVQTDPFTLGVASGDPAPDGVVIWTRLAPHPLADDGLGGMPARAVDVDWEVAADERFTRIEQRGITTAAPGRGARCARRTDRPTSRRRLLLPVPHRGSSVTGRAHPHRARPRARSRS